MKAKRRSNQPPAVAPGTLPEWRHAEKMGLARIGRRKLKPQTPAAHKALDEAGMWPFVMDAYHGLVAGEIKSKPASGARRRGRNPCLRPLSNPWPIVIQFVEGFQSKAEAAEALEAIALQQGFLGGRYYAGEGKFPGWKMQAFFQDEWPALPLSAPVPLPDGNRRVVMPPGLALALRRAGWTKVPAPTNPPSARRAGARARRQPKR